MEFIILREEFITVLWFGKHPNITNWLINHDWTVTFLSFAAFCIFAAFWMFASFLGVSIIVLVILIVRANT
jgi:hypothetical protein